jgi:exonuclease SbcC
MLPLKLELKNFMAYREGDALDLTGLRTVVLTGDNGAGKSTLLDAMTWALWGQARAKRDDELISQNTSEMRVGLTFSEGKNIYQVVRTRKLGGARAASTAAAKGKAPSSSGSLDFLIKDDKEVSGWRSLSEPKISETQAKIEREINLSYDTFINSAYLKQGRADEFTLKPPAERKALLSEILSLNIWPEYEARVKERAEAVQREIEKREYEFGQAESEITKLPEYERALGEAQTSARESSHQLEQAEQAQAEMNQQRERANSLRAQLQQANARLSELGAQAAKLQAERAKHQQLQAQYESALNEREHIEQGFAELNASRQLNEELNLKLSSLVELNARKSGAEHALADARRNLQSERDAADRVVVGLELAAKDEEIVLRLASCLGEIEALQAQQKRREELERERNTSSEKQGEAKAQNGVLRGEMSDLKARIGALSKVGAICPTCGRELLEEDRVRILDEWQSLGKTHGDAYRANELLMKELAEKASAIEKNLAQLDTSLRKLPSLQKQQAELESGHARALEAQKLLPEALHKRHQFEQQLQAEQYAPAARAALATVTQELAALGYDAAAHKRLREVKLKQLEVFVERKSQLDRAALGLESEQRALASLDLQEQNANAQHDREQSQISNLQSLISECEKALVSANDIAAALQRARDDYFKAQRRVGEANQRVQSCLALQGTRDRLASEMDALNKKAALLDELRAAFGKNGVPAMIIESVLPELEANANDLLGKMTAGRMNVRFETQRQTQSGTVSETLELRINDEIGERAYEMFSGGEAFRINFAVRIALSKLLAHRAGAQLQTLFVDEGFGTQDAAGRERLVEAIRAIEDDFERIVIITHIDELKDAFPARIEVTKTARGSVARIV